MLSKTEDIKDDYCKHPSPLFTMFTQPHPLVANSARLFQRIEPQINKQVLQALSVWGTSILLALFFYISHIGSLILHRFTNTCKCYANNFVLLSYMYGTKYIRFNMSQKYITKTMGLTCYNEN